MGELREIRVPDIGDFKEVPIIEIAVKLGEHITAEAPLVTLESDKASMEVPSPTAGLVKSLAVKIGDKVSEGSPILMLEVDGAAAAPEPVKPAVSAPPAPTSAPAGVAEVRVPDIGDFKDVPIIEIMVKAGDSIAPEQPLLTLESDKASMDVPSPLAGTVAELKVKVGDRVSEGSTILTLVTDAAAAAAPARRTPAAPVPAPAAAAKPSATAAAGAAGGLDLLPWPKVDFAKFGPVESKPLSRIKKISAANLHRNWVMIPHVTSHDEADITELEEFRVRLNKENEKSGVRVSMLAFMIKAAVASLRKFPEFNSSLEGNNLILKKYYHIGFAADTPQGLLVPVIRDADKKGIIEIAREMGELARLARDGKLKPDQMQGGTFSISSLGGIGGTYFTPIINAPEVAIMGACRSFHKMVWDGKQATPRLMQPLSLSWDHRVIDGAAAARFNVYFASLLADMRRALV